MNDCARMREAMHEALDSGVAEPGRGVRVHMAECPECAHLYRQLVATEETLRLVAGPMEPLPSGLHSGIMGALRRGGSVRALRGRRAGLAWRSALAAAAAVLVAACLLALVRMGAAPGVAPVARSAGVAAVPIQAPSLSVAPAEAGAEPLLDETMGAALRDAVVPEVIVAAAQDFSSLADAIRSNTASAARAMLPELPGCVKALPLVHGSHEMRSAAPSFRFDLLHPRVMTGQVQ